MDKQKIIPFQIEKPWGNFRQFTHNMSSTVKILTVKKDEQLSLQSHEKRAEFWKVIDGDGLLELDGVKRYIKKGDEIDIPIKAKHRIIAGPLGIKVLEIAVGDFDENDIIRYEDKYGRI